MRSLEKHEIQFWNQASISILVDAGFELQVNDGLIVGIGRRNEECRGNENGN